MAKPSGVVGNDRSTIRCDECPLPDLLVAKYEQAPRSRDPEQVARICRQLGDLAHAAEMFCRACQELELEVDAPKSISIESATNTVEAPPQPAAPVPSPPKIHPTTDASPSSIRASDTVPSVISRERKYASYEQAVVSMFRSNPGRRFTKAEVLETIGLVLHEYGADVDEKTTLAVFTATMPKLINDPGSPIVREGKTKATRYYWANDSPMEVAYTRQPSNEGAPISGTEMAADDMSEDSGPEQETLEIYHITNWLSVCYPGDGTGPRYYVNGHDAEISSNPSKVLGELINNPQGLTASEVFRSIRESDDAFRYEKVLGGINYLKKIFGSYGITESIILKKSTKAADDTYKLDGIIDDSEDEDDKNTDVDRTEKTGPDFLG